MKFDFALKFIRILFPFLVRNSFDISYKRAEHIYFDHKALTTKRIRLFLFHFFEQYAFIKTKETFIFVVVVAVYGCVHRVLTLCV